MKTSTNGLAFIQNFEGVKLTTYLDLVGIPTIGVGHTGPDVHLGMTITQAQATALLAGDVVKAEVAIHNCVKVALTQNAFDALVSLVFNIGGAAFAGSTLLRKLNEGDYKGAAEAFASWSHAGGKVLAGLYRRRLAEAALFLKA